MGIFTRKILRSAWIAGCSLLVSLYVFAGITNNFKFSFEHPPSIESKPAPEVGKRPSILLSAQNLAALAPPYDPKVEFELAEYKVTEFPENPNIVWVGVTLDAPTTNTVTVPYSILYGGTNTQDFTILSGASPIVFAPGETRKLIEVEIKNNDTQSENTEAFEFKMASNVNRGSIDKTKITIYEDRDNSRPRVNFLVSDYAQLENNGTDILVKVVLYYQDDEETEEETVKYRISGSATEGVDYTITNVQPNRKFTFDEGDEGEGAVYYFIIRILNDMITDPGETIKIELESVQGGEAHLGDIKEYTLLIVEDNSVTGPTLSSPLTATTCSDNLFSYTPTSVTAGTTFSWSRAARTGISNAAASGVGNINETLINTTTTPVNVTYVYTLTATSGINTQNVVVTVQPRPIITLTSINPTTCTSNNGSIDLNGLINGSAYTVNYIKNDVAQPALNRTAAGGQVTLNNLSAGNYTNITITAGGCTSNALSVVLSGPVPATPGAITGTSPVCAPAINQPFSVAAVTNATTYTWAYSGTGATFTNGTTRSPTINFAPGATSGTLTVTASNACGTSAARSMAIMVNPTPMITATPSNPSTCANTDGSIALNGVTNGLSYTINYSKNSTAQTPVTQIAAGGMLTLSGLSIGDYADITVRANGCTSNGVTATLNNPAPAAHGPITGPSSICAPFAGQVYTIAAVPGATSYTWDYSGTGATILGGTTTTATITFAANATSGNLSVTATNACNTSAASIKAFTVNATPRLSSTLTPPSTPSGNVFVYTPVSTVPGTAFSWSRAAVPENPASAGSGSISETLTNTTASAINLTYTYTLTANGCTNTQNVSVMVNSASAVNLRPTANNVQNFPVQNITGQVSILPLAGTDTDGAISLFTIASLPSAASGRLYLNGNPVTVNQQLTPAEASNLKFGATPSYIGNSQFNYTVTDNEVLVSANTATFTIPVTNNSTSSVCQNGQLSANLLGARGTFSAPYITPNTVANCVNGGSVTSASPPGNLGNPKPELTGYKYAGASGGLGPEGTYSFLKTIGKPNVSPRNCIKGDWVGSDRTGDGGYFMVINGASPASTVGAQFFEAEAITVCPNTLYEFSAYVLNVLPGNSSAAASGSEPNISFYINGEHVSTSGRIAYSTASTNYNPEWVKVGGLWYSGPNTTTVTLRIDNATSVATGNDLGLDDISMAICGLDIEYPRTGLDPKFCLPSAMPLEAEIKSSINTYTHYIFQKKKASETAWIDMPSGPGQGNPVFDGTQYVYTAVYGSFPVTVDMNGDRYRVKVATSASNLLNDNCNIIAGSEVTVTAFEQVVVPPGFSICNAASTAALPAAGPGETWSFISGPEPAVVNSTTGAVSGMNNFGTYTFKLANTAGCEGFVEIKRDNLTNRAGADVTALCSFETTYKFPTAPNGYNWEFVSGPATATINNRTGQTTGLTANGTYTFLVSSEISDCTDEVTLTKTNCVAPSISIAPLDAVKPEQDPNLTTPFTFRVSRDPGTASTGNINFSYKLLPLSPSPTNADGDDFFDLLGVFAPSGSITIPDTQPFKDITIEVNSDNTDEFDELFTVQIEALTAGVTVTTDKADGLIIDDDTPPPNVSFEIPATTIRENATTGRVTVKVKLSAPAATYTKVNFSTSANSALRPGDYVFPQGSQGNVGYVEFNPGESEAFIVLDVVNDGIPEPMENLLFTLTTVDDNNAIINGQITHTVTIPDDDRPPVAVNETLEMRECDPILGGTLANGDFDPDGDPIKFILGPYDLNKGVVTILDETSGQFRFDPALNPRFEGPFYVTYYVSDGNTQVEGALTIENTYNLILGVNFITDEQCFGGSDGSIILTPTGGSGQYSYIWEDGTTVRDRTGLPAGLYTVTVKDIVQGCSTTTEIVITESPQIVIDPIVENVTCFGGSDGEIKSNVSGGNGTYSFQWTGPDGFTSTDENLTGLKAGEYNLTVTDAENGDCVQPALVTVTEPAQISCNEIDLAGPGSFCEADDPQLINGCSPSGGSGAYVYQWQSSLDELLWNDITGATSEDFDPYFVTQTTYFRRIVTSGSCPDPLISNVITINIFTRPEITGSTFTDPTTCLGTDGSIELDGLTVGANYSISYSKDGVAQTPVTKTATSGKLLIDGLSAGEYTDIMVIVPAEGCASIALNGTLTGRPPPEPSAITGTATLCASSANVVYTTDLVPDAVSYTWAYTGTGATITANDNTATVTFSEDATSGDITVTANNSCGSSNATTYAITVNSLPELVITNPDEVCSPNTVDLTAAAITDGSTDDLDYSYYTDAAGTVALTAPEAVAVSGTYYIKGETAEVCSSDILEVVVIINPATAISIQPAGASYCISTTATDLSITATGAGTLTYQWYRNVANSTTAGTAISSATISSYTPPTVTAGTTYYYVTVSGTCGTVTSNTAAVIINPATAISIQPAGASYCISTTATDLSITATGAGTLTYQWYRNVANSTTAGTAISSATTSSYTPPTVTAGTTYYYVTVSGTCGTVTSNTAAVIINPATAISLIGDIQICAGKQLQAISFTGTSGATFKWKNDNTNIGLTESGNNNISRFIAKNTTTEPKIATITVTPVLNGCEGTPISFSITVYPKFECNTLTPPAETSFCASGNAETIIGCLPQGGDGQHTYNWQSSTDGDTFTDIQAAIGKDYNPPLLTTTTWYRRKVTSAICGEILESNSVKISIFTPPVMDQPENLIVCAGTSAFILFNGAPDGAVYEWTNNKPSIGLPARGTDDLDFTALNTSNKPIEATITVKAKTGNCPGDARTFRITVNPNLTAANAGADQGPLNTISVTLNGNRPVSGSGEWTLLSGQGNYQITDPGRYNTTVTGLIPGTYEFSWTITGADCGSSTDAVTIIIDDATDKPVAVNDAASTDENIPVTFSIVENDTGPIDPATLDLDPVSPGVQVLYSIQGQGRYTVDRNGILTFTPVAGFTGAAKPVSYTVRNMLGELSNQAVISITVNPTISLNPFAMDDYAETVMDEPVIIAVVDNDIHDTGTLDPKSVKIITLPEHGTVVVKPDGTVVYTPETGFTGTDNFSYTIDDTDGRTSNTAEVIIFINEFRSVGPVAFDDFAETKKGNTVTIAIAENDIHDTGTLDLGSIKIVGFPMHGTIEIGDDVENNGSVIYIPDADYTGNDSFTYTIRDFEGNESNIATVDVVVTAEEETFTPVEEDPADGSNKEISIDPLVSPNGDGYGNEFFVIRNIQAFENEVSIFNRWGNEVFRIKGYNEADRVFAGYANMGIFLNKGEPLTNGVYYYIIYTYKTVNGEQVKYLNKGYLILKR